jgi:hypothetical protein
MFPLLRGFGLSVAELKNITGCPLGSLFKLREATAALARRGGRVRV